MPPTGKARRLSIWAADVDVDSADFESLRSVEWAGSRDRCSPAAHRPRRRVPSDGEQQQRGRQSGGATFARVFWRQRRGNPSGLWLVPASNGQKPLTYADAGVSIDAGNALVKAIGPLARSTARPGADAELGGFGGFFDLKAAGYSDPLLVAANDGVGTKLKLAIETGRHDGVGIDLVAMCANDLIVQGAEPLFFLDYFATGKLDNEVAAAVVASIAEGCRQAGCALIGGETAEMPGMYAGRLRPRRLLRRRGRARQGADRRGHCSRRRHSRPRQLGRPQQRLLAGARIVEQRGWDLEQSFPERREDARRGAARARRASTCARSCRSCRKAGSRAWRTSPAADYSRIFRGFCLITAMRSSMRVAGNLPSVFALLQEGGASSPRKWRGPSIAGSGWSSSSRLSRRSKSSQPGGRRETAFEIGRIEDGQRGCTVRGQAGAWNSPKDWSATYNA